MFKVYKADLISGSAFTLRKGPGTMSHTIEGPAGAGNGPGQRLRAE